MGDSEQRVTHLYGQLKANYFYDEQPYRTKQFDFNQGTVKAFTVSCDGTIHPPLGK